MRHLLALLPLVCALSSPAFGDNLLTGRWYSEGNEDGRHLQFVLANNPDGTFVKNIRNGTNCRAIATWVETGSWSFDGKRYAETTETVGGQKFDTATGEFKDAFDVARVENADHLDLG